MSHYIIAQYPYESIQIALCKQGLIIESTQFHKFNATALTIPCIEKMLTQHKLTLSDIVCIGMNVGPGPYNTLRALLTMANGIHFVRKIPLINSSALELLPQEYPKQNSIVLLHAFANNLFYAVRIDNTFRQGSGSISEVIQLINNIQQPLVALGNGAQMHKDVLMQECKNIVFLQETPLFNTLEILAQVTYSKLLDKNYGNSYLKPIYFEDLTS